ncbi:SpoIID/LytB domain-containing protein [Monashia sp. NPDC004114]
MRCIPTVVSVTVLTATLVVAPTVPSGARPHPVAPVVHEVGIPSTTTDSAARRAARSGVGEHVVGATEVRNIRFDLAGVTFDRTPPAGTHVEVRTHGTDGWSAWTELGVDDDGPDPGSADAAHARPGTDTVAALGSDAIDIRVSTPDGTVPRGMRASLVDGGTSAADSSVGAPAGSAVAAVTRPVIHTRAEWGADESIRTCVPERLSGFKAVVVHHTVNSNSYTADQVPSLIRAMYAYHVRSLGWCDIGYQLLVDRFGRIWQGRYGSTTGFVVGAQTGGFNTETTGVAVIGDYTSVPFSSATQSAVTQAVAWEADRSLFDPSTTTTLTSAGSTRYAAGVRVTKPRTMGHRDLSQTDCPGDTAYARQVPAIRSAAGTTWRAGQWSAQPARTASETYLRPASSVLTLSGRGYGHGIGMSQWGAYGAARAGLTWPQILAFYYPGTTRTTQGEPTLRVWLSAVGSSAVPLVSQSGLTITDGTRRSYLSTAYRWRVVREGSTLSLQASSGAGWTYVTTWRGSAKPLTVSRPGTVRIGLPDGTQREYTGSVRVSVSGSRLYAVNLVPFEAYVRAVVPVEMPASWSAAALSAQAVAARTFAANARAGAGTRVYDICDVDCQQYRGVADYTGAGALTVRHEDTRATAATQATAGIVLTYGGKPALAQYSASNGGRTVSGGTAYLPAKNDPYDGAVASASNPHAWSSSIQAATLERAYPAIGSLRSVAVGPRAGGGGTGTWGGRVTSVTLTGSGGSVTVTGAAFRTRTGLRSTWWTVTSRPPRSAAYSPRDVTGDSRSDVLVPTGASLQALSYTGQLGFTQRQILGSGFSGMRAAAAVGAFDNDTLGDVVAIGSDGTAWLYRGLGASGLSAGRVVLATGWGSVNLIVPVGDWTGDGYTDILTRLSSGSLVLRHGDGSGRIVSSTTIGSGWGGFRQVTAGDFDGDGRRDLMAVRSSDGALVLYPGDGAGRFRPARVIGTSGWKAMSAVRGVGDITGDGRDDLLTRRAVDGALLVYRVVQSARLTTPLRAGTYASTAAWGQ